MLELYIMRHGESGFISGQKDVDRALTKQGESDIKMMSRYLKNEAKFDFVLCSVAKRTKSTFYLLDLKTETVFENEIYEGSVELILKHLFRAKGQSVLYIGHNPGVTLLVQYLTGYSQCGMVPGSCVKIKADIEEWELISQNLFQFEWYKYPEMF